MDRVRLNVGGTIYETTHTTLRHGAPHFLSCLSEHNARQNDTPIFIDRCGQLFFHILNYLRSSNIHCPDELLGAVCDEAAFYCIKPLHNWLCEHRDRVAAQRTRHDAAVCGIRNDTALLVNHVRTLTQGVEDVQSQLAVIRRNIGM